MDSLPRSLPSRLSQHRQKSLFSTRSVTPSELGTLVDGCVLTVAARANNGEQLVLADGFGRVRLLRYPAVNDDQVSHENLVCLVWYG